MDCSITHCDHEHGGACGGGGIYIEELESELEGDVELRGFLGLGNDVPKGYTDIRIQFRLMTEVGNLERLQATGTVFSPVSNTITQGANLDIRVEAKRLASVANLDDAFHSGLRVGCWT